MMGELGQMSEEWELDGRFGRSGRALSMKPKQLYFVST